MASVYSVTQVNSYIRNMFSQDFLLRRLSVKGEVSNCKYHTSGHIYFTLKDGGGTLSAVMFAGQRRGLKFRLEEGQQVVVKGTVDVYERDGKYQLYASEIELAGRGDLYVQFERLFRELQEMGMFDAQYKRPIPQYAKTVGIVTAPTGAAVRDIIQIAKRRDPRVKIALFPTLVQGESAAEDIVNSLKLANSWGKADVIILGRGGGSMEDLWAFNEEIVARAIFASEVPVISAVGHETDFTIADFVSDLRAPTPSAAAELATVHLDSIRMDVEELTDRLTRDVQAVLTTSKRRLDFLKERPVLKRPLERIQRTQMYLEEKERLLLRETLRKLEKNNMRLATAGARLEAVSPFSVMQRGYAMAMDEMGNPVTSVLPAKEGQALQVRMKDGMLMTTVTGKKVFDGGKKETDI